MQRDRASIMDILDSIDLINGHIGQMSKQDFWNDIKTQDSVIRRFTVIGEAVKRLSSELQDRYPDIPWREMIGMRNILSHAFQNRWSKALWIGRRAPQYMQFK